MLGASNRIVVTGNCKSWVFRRFWKVLSLTRAVPHSRQCGLSGNFRCVRCCFVLFSTGAHSADARVDWESTSRCGVETGTSSLGNGRQVDVYISQSLAGARLIHRCAATETRLFCFTCQAICCFILKRFSRAPNLAPLATCKATDRAASNHEVWVFEVHGRYVCHSL